MFRIATASRCKQRSAASAPLRGPTEQLEPWKDRGLAATTVNLTGEQKAIIQGLETADYTSLLNKFVGCCKTRFIFSEDVKKAQTFIEEHFKESGLEVSSMPFEAEFYGTKQYKGNGYNVLGVLKGEPSTKPEEYVVLGAHYDSVPMTGPAPGALALVVWVSLNDYRGV